MKEHFIGLNDSRTARLFLPSSTEWIQSLGSDPLCVVSELPLFLIGKLSPSLQEPVSKALREELDRLRASPPDLDTATLQQIEADYQLTTVPLELQVRLQISMIILALTAILEGGIRKESNTGRPSRLF
jgi:hypothetical protein